MGKRIVIELDEERFIVIHLMVAGRFRWLQPGANVPGKIGLAAFDFEHGTLALTEAGSKRRASIHLLRGADALGAFDRGGVEVMDATPEEFRAALLKERHTVKRALTDPRLFSGIGNAYSDEILHAREALAAQADGQAGRRRARAPLRRHARHAAPVDRRACGTRRRTGFRRR